MKINFFNSKLFILITLLNIYYLEEEIDFTDNSYYYEEKYFRILANNYETIDPGNMWKGDEDGYGFIAKKDFGSLILLKDWSMYNFKLTKIMLRNQCLFNYQDIDCAAEMWLIHTKDNGYYPPGRRIFMKQNYFTIVVPFVEAKNGNPAVDSIFEYLNLKEYVSKMEKVSPKKPVKLYQIIQNQPSFLFEGTYNKKDTLFMVFSQYHFISQDDLDNLNKLNFTNVKTDTIIEDYSKIYRNVRNTEEVKPKVTLMSYSNSKYLENLLFFIIIFLL